MIYIHTGNPDRTLGDDEFKGLSAAAAEKLLAEHPKQVFLSGLGNLSVGAMAIAKTALIDGPFYEAAYAKELSLYRNGTIAVPQKHKHPDTGQQAYYVLWVTN